MMKNYFRTTLFLYDGRRNVLMLKIYSMLCCWKDLFSFVTKLYNRDIPKSRGKAWQVQSSHQFAIYYIRKLLMRTFISYYTMEREQIIHYVLLSISCVPEFFLINSVPNIFISTSRWRKICSSAHKMKKFHTHYYIQQRKKTLIC